MPQDHAADPRFDAPIDRRGTNCMKWDGMEALYGVPPSDGIAMWVADMDFRPPQVVSDAVARLHEHGVYGYPGADDAHREAVAWWMRERHGWALRPEWIFTTHGLVNGTGVCVDAFTLPGDGVVLFTPVYHAFARVIRAAGRQVVECELPLEDGRYVCDFDAWDAEVAGSGASMMILCSPHNPNGRVWSRAELEGFAAFARRHGLVLVSDEIHHDLVYPGHTHVPMANVTGPEGLVTMTATTKTFNIAGAHTGNVTIEDPGLRQRFARRKGALGLSPSLFGLEMARAAYSPEGAEWVDALMRYLDRNRRIFDEGVNAIPGVGSVALEATYLSWVDFGGTGMSHEEVARRVEGDARIAANHGPTFGRGGESFLRFNIATTRANVERAVERLQAAFSDLQ
ncbi:MalY/PatB family protein [Jannaschia sp. W003]|uniref:MalY/PatB family protein n=1 Tax=Jannaschia sp. W003 TaxID=2867012 RepID=UPI0021A57391|nr:MalY/PatB family protein [Jannaschia sp. W003]UWQ22876.1 pyridoxal phosphate-dependent aminotransferase [Jannaschia sp. W003]